MADDSEKLTKALEEIFRVMPKYLDDRRLRLLAGCAARGYGRGGIRKISDLSGLSTTSVRLASRETDPESGAGTPTRGRKPLKELEPALISTIQTILEDSTEGLLSWTGVSLREISGRLMEEYHINAGKDVVARALEDLGYTSRYSSGRKRDGRAQADFINKKAREFMDAGLPVITLDTKRGELDDALPLSSDPATVFVKLENTCQCIRLWWRMFGASSFPRASRLYVISDLNENGEEELWKYQLALLAEETGMEIHLSPLPSGTFRWNRLENRLFFYLTRNWQGKMLTEVNAVISLLSAPAVKCEPDRSGVRNMKGIRSSIPVEYLGPDTWENCIIRGLHPKGQMSIP